MWFVVTWRTGKVRNSRDANWQKLDRMLEMEQNENLYSPAFDLLEKNQPVNITACLLHIS